MKPDGSIHCLCLSDFKAYLSALDNLLVLSPGRASLRQPSLDPYSLYLEVGPLQFFFHSMSTHPLILSSFCSCLCNLFQERQPHSRPAGILSYNLSATFLPWAVDAGVDMQIPMLGLGSPICYSLYCAHLWFPVVVSICHSEASFMRGGSFICLWVQS